MSTAYYDGQAIFGLAVQCQHEPRPSAKQINTFFGVSGTQLLWGGGRGRIFLVEGVLVATDFPSLAAVEQILLSYDDGIARTFTDTWGVTWPNVVFTGKYQRQGCPGWLLLGGDVYVGQAYRAVFEGLT